VNPAAAAANPAALQTGASRPPKGDDDEDVLRTTCVLSEPAVQTEWTDEFVRNPPLPLLLLLTASDSDDVSSPKNDATSSESADVLSSITSSASRSDDGSERGRPVAGGSAFRSAFRRFFFVVDGRARTP